MSRKMERFVLVVVCLCGACATLPASARSQDLLSLFLEGSQSALPVGGDPISSPDPAVPGPAPARPSVTYDYRLDDIYHELRSDGNEDAFGRSAHSVEAVLPLSQGPAKPVVTFSYESSRFTGKLNQALNQGGAFSSVYGTASLRYTMRLAGAIAIGAGIGKCSDGPRSSGNYESTLSIRPAEGSLLSTTIGSWGSWQSVSLDINGVRGILPLDSRRQGAETFLQMPLWGMRLQARYRHNAITAVNMDPGNFDTRMLPAGTVNAYSIASLWKPGERFSCMVRLQLNETTGDARFVSSTSDYGAIRNLSSADRSFLAASRYEDPSGRLVVADLEVRALSGRLEGYVESWPFVGIFETLISQREYFKGDAALRYWKLHAGAWLPLSHTSGAGIGVNYLHITPRLDLSTWQPQFLIYGVRAYHERSMDIESLGLLLLTAGVDHRFGHVALRYSIAQFVPVAVARSAGTPGTGSGPGPASPVSVSHSGGQMHSCLLSYVF